VRSITDLFIRRPVLALVVNLLILIAGVQAIRTLNVRQYPRSENASVTVTTVYVGASADLIRGFITAPLERAIAGADGIDYLESQSALSVSTITAHLKLNQDSRKALAEIASKVDQVRGDLPPDAQVPVINIESADSQFASCYLSFSSDILHPNEITDYLVRVVQPRLSALGGVQRADILGGRTFAMRIWLKPDRMAALNISPVQVRQALEILRQHVVDSESDDDPCDRHRSHHRHHHQLIELAVDEHHRRRLLVLFRLSDEIGKREGLVDRSAERVAQHPLIETDHHHQRGVDPFGIVHKHRGDSFAVARRDHLAKRVIRRHQSGALNDALGVLLEQAIEHARPRHQSLADCLARGGHAHGVDQDKTAYLHDDHQQKKERQDSALQAAHGHGAKHVHGQRGRG